MAQTKLIALVACLVGIFVITDAAPLPSNGYHSLIDVPGLVVRLGNMLSSSSNDLPQRDSTEVAPLVDVPKILRTLASGLSSSSNDLPQRDSTEVTNLVTDLLKKSTQLGTLLQGSTNALQPEDSPNGLDLARVLQNIGASLAPRQRFGDAPNGLVPARDQPLVGGATKLLDGGLVKQLLAAIQNLLNSNGGSPLNVIKVGGATRLLDGGLVKQLLAAIQNLLNSNGGSPLNVVKEVIPAQDQPLAATEAIQNVLNSNGGSPLNVVKGAVPALDQPLANKIQHQE